MVEQNKKTKQEVPDTQRKEKEFRRFIKKEEKITKRRTIKSLM